MAQMSLLESPRINPLEALRTWLQSNGWSIQFRQAYMDSTAGYASIFLEPGETLLIAHIVPHRLRKSAHSKGLPESIAELEECIQKAMKYAVSIGFKDGWNHE